MERVPPTAFWSSLALPDRYHRDDLVNLVRLFAPKSLRISARPILVRPRTEWNEVFHRAEPVAGNANDVVAVASAPGLPIVAPVSGVHALQVFFLGLWRNVLALSYSIRGLVPI